MPLPHLLQHLLSPPSPAPTDPEPAPTPTGTVREATADAPCGTQDPTWCGLVHRVTGDMDLAQQITPIIVAGGFIALVLIVAVVLRGVLHRVINRTVEGIAAEKADEGGRRRRGRLDMLEPVDPISAARKAQRARAIGSILRASVSVVVWTAAVFVILPELGVNITGLVAGAGIVGIALGFGAQTLVQDFISGLFMIAEDQYGVGDVIDMGEASGVVEAVGLRTTRLRAVDGTVWHIRNGEVVRVGNMSQGWSRAVLDTDVAYGEDVTRVMEVLKELGTQMRADPSWSDKFLDEPEVWGVEALAADGVTIRMIIKTVPLQQWVIAREMRRRIKHRFDTLGIEIPFPQRTVWVRADGPGAEEAARALSDDAGSTGSTGSTGSSGSSEEQPSRRSGLSWPRRGGRTDGPEHDSPPTSPTAGPAASGVAGGAGGAPDASYAGTRSRGTGEVPVDGSDIPPAPQSRRGEAEVAHEDSPDPLRGEPFSASEEPVAEPEDDAPRRTDT